MPFTYDRIVRFQDTDAAGVVYFAKVLAMCHDAYEASLAASAINLKTFFSNQNLAVPIVHASINFYRPLFCGDRLAIQLTPQPLTSEEFEITYQIFLETVSDRSLAQAITKHVCIDPVSRTRKQFSEELMQWFHFCQAS